MSSKSRYFANPYTNEDVEDANSWDHARISERSNKHWRKIIDEIVAKEPAENADSDGGLYVGPAGIAYALIHASERLPTDDNGTAAAKRYLALAQNYLDGSLRDLEKRDHRVDCSFLLGDAGVIAVAAVLARKNGDSESSEKFAKRYVDMADRCGSINSSNSRNSEEFFVGRAGYLFGSLWLNKQFRKIVVPIDVMHELAGFIVLTGTNYAHRRKSPCPLMYAYYDTEYLGAAHGLAAILQVLIQVPDFLDKNKEADRKVRACVEYLLTVETSSGNYPCALDEIGDGGCVTRDKSNDLVHWCHGAPGVVYLFAAAFLRWKDRRYLEACQRSADLVWHQGLLKKGPGLCHGIAGNGYVFLLLHRLTSDKRYLRRASRFADFLESDNFKSGAQTPDRPYSLYEGIAGTACFLADLAQPEKAAFPFQDVF